VLATKLDIVESTDDYNWIKFLP